MPHISGPKVRGIHTTILEGSAPILRSLMAHPLVTGLSPGFIKPNSGGGSGNKFCKITICNTCIEVVVTLNGSAQTLRVYTTEPQAVAETIARAAAGLRTKGFKVRFGKHRQR